MLAKACYPDCRRSIKAGRAVAVFHAETFSARSLDALRQRLTPGHVALVAGIALLAFLLGALLLDEPVSQALQAWPDFERALFLRLTRLGKSDWILIPSALVVAGAALALQARLDDAWRQAMRGLVLGGGFIFVGVALPGIVTVIIKRIVGRARPYVENASSLDFHPFNLLENAYHSFPSGHSTTAIAFSIVLFTLTNGRFRGLFLALGVLIGLSRIVVGDHYLTDVIGGLFVGTIFSLAVRDLFATRGWGMSIENGRVVSHIHRLFVPLIARYRRER